MKETGEPAELESLRSTSVGVGDIDERDDDAVVLLDSVSDVDGDNEVDLRPLRRLDERTGVKDVETWGDEGVSRRRDSEATRARSWRLFSSGKE